MQNLSFENQAVIKCCHLKHPVQLSLLSYSKIDEYIYKQIIEEQQATIEKLIEENNELTIQLLNYKEQQQNES